MPVAFEGPPTELAGLTMFLEEQRAAILRNLDGLTEELARHAGHADIIREPIDGTTGP